MELNYVKDELSMLLHMTWLLGAVRFDLNLMEQQSSLSIFKHWVFRTKAEKKQKPRKKRITGKKQLKLMKHLLSPEFIKKAFFMLVHKLHLRFFLFLKTGFETPLLTGFLMPVSCTLRSIADGKIEIYPDFSSATLILKSSLRARIMILSLLFMVIQLIIFKRRSKYG